MPKIVDHNQRREEIAHIAIKTFAKKSYASVTMQILADEAGIAKGSIYKYFKSKEDLLKHVTHQFLSGFEELFRSEDLKHLDPYQKINRHFYSAIEAIESYQDLYLVYLEIWTDNINGKHSEIKKIIDNYFDSYRRETAAIIQEGQEQELFNKTKNPMDLATYLIASLDGITIHYLYNTDKFNLREVAETFFTTFCDGLMQKST